MEKIIVYGVCDDNGDSWIFIEEPFKEDEAWICGEFDSELNLPVKNLFPKDKPIKFELKEILDD